MRRAGRTLVDTLLRLLVCAGAMACDEGSPPLDASEAGSGGTGGHGNGTQSDASSTTGGSLGEGGTQTADGSSGNAGTPGDGASPSDGEGGEGGTSTGAGFRGASPLSRYLALPAEKLISARGALLTVTIDLPVGAWVYLQSEGWYRPEVKGVASMSLSVDSATVGGGATIDWTRSTNAVEHSFEVIGAVNLGAGAHTISLVANPISGTFRVGANTNLCVMVGPAPTVSTHALTADRGPFNFTTLNIQPGTPVPHTPLLSETVVASGQHIIALAAGRVYEAGQEGGDPMLGIYLDGRSPGNAKAVWTVNDLWSGAEQQAPVFTHAFLSDIPAGNHVISLDASEFPWPSLMREDPAVYKVGAGATLIVLQGQMPVAGSTPRSDLFDYEGDWFAIGGTNTGKDMLFASGDFVVPADHSGVVQFAAKSRVQGDKRDPGGTVELWLELDGARVGSTGLQRTRTPNGDSQRSISASYLAAGESALRPGSHRIEVHTRAQGTFTYMSLVNDLPLVWFD